MAKKKIQELETQLATHEIFGQFRFIQIGEEIWFAAVDVAEILGIENVRQNLANFPDAERMTVCTTYSHSGKRGGAQKITYVNEPGLYRLIFTSRKPEAEKFKRWVFHDVLPSIRKTGKYEMPQQIEEDEDTYNKDDWDKAMEILRDLDKKGIEYDWEITAITPRYDEKTEELWPVYNVKWKLID